MSLPMSIEAATIHPRWTRRQALQRMAGGFGTLALVRLLEAGSGPFAPKPTDFPAKARRFVFRVLNGGMAQLETFEPEPMLSNYKGQSVPGGAASTERS